ncbi:hypothetical protein A2917_00850 [Candidatus Nomurabacteria bacterium RIFCSPLOWO2_01_FULL_42_17]|uniref:ATP synthase subunit b n=1 Tax=Candidatus Nomurabacteria bacterium RIFCSPLOWO2_01_FULL_42_17 TaxID=1801780 RepID=A0A1F6XM51_9BACT|nr:MAG: hypothetical protein A2917_00850 [Candidatus Nomurabacteria bacterium RIFCSPLOWO2_01_FULL_42_17]
MQEFIDTFHIDWKLMIAQLINFGIVFLVFYLLAAKPLRKLMQDRGDLISKGVDDAKKNDAMLKATKAEYDEMLVKARVESNKIFQEGQKDLEQLKAETMEKIKKDTDEWQKNRIKQIEIDKNIIVESVKEDIVSLATLAANKIMDEKNK